MNLLLVAPLLLTVGGLLVGWFLPRFVSPAAAARVLTGAVVLATASIGSAFVLVVLAASTDKHAASGIIGWCCALFPGDHGAAPWAGAVAGLLLAIGVVRAFRHRRRVRAEHAPFADIDGLEVVTSPEPIAFAVPGRPGGVVIGSVLLSCLDADERAAVLAHEYAHLRFHHHRYVYAVELCAAAVPLLIPLARQVRFATERWADEAAAAEIGSRHTLARTIARVALMSRGEDLTPALAFSGRGTSIRVDALLHPGDRRRLELPTAALSLTVLATLAGSSVQVHHLAMFLVHACRA